MRRSLGEYDIQDILTGVSPLPDDDILTGTVADHVKRVLWERSGSNPF